MCRGRRGWGRLGRRSSRALWGGVSEVFGSSGLLLRVPLGVEMDDVAYPMFSLPSPWLEVRRVSLVYL